MKYTLSIIALCIALSGFAQTEPAGKDKSLAEPPNCLLNTSKEEWTALGLTQDQVDRVSSIQTDCKTDCAPVKGTGAVDPKTTKASLQKHAERVRKVLTDQQYAKWLDWCKERVERTGSL